MPLRIIPALDEPPDTPRPGPAEQILARAETKARHVLARWPRGPWQTEARRLARTIRRAREALRTPYRPIAEILTEIFRLSDRLDAMGRARLDTILLRARRFRGGSAPGRHDALSLTLRGLLEPDPRAANKDVWLALHALAEKKTGHPVVARVEARIVYWRPDEGRPEEKKTSRKAVYNRLAQERAALLSSGNRSPRRRLTP